MRRDEVVGRRARVASVPLRSQDSLLGAEGDVVEMDTTRPHGTLYAIRLDVDGTVVWLPPSSLELGPRPAGPRR